MKYGLPLTLCALLLASVSCGDDDENDVPTTGAIEVVTVTTGADIDPDGYTVTVDGVDGPTIGANSSVTLPNLTAGTYSVGLDGLALNCQTTNNPRNVNVVAGQTASAQFDVTCVGPNSPPVADAGPNQGVVDADNSGSEAVTLDGSSSADADGTIASWSWSVNSVEFGTGETLTVSAPVGVHTVILTVTDDEGATDTDDVVISVGATGGNTSPVADAGPNQPVLDADDSGSEAVTLDGSGSTDADGTIASWSWSENSVEFGTGETLVIAFDTGVHTVTLTVTDHLGATGIDQVVITVVPTTGNLPPIADAGPDQTVLDADRSGSEAVTLDGSGSTDLDGTIASWTWSESGAEIGTGETLNTEFDVGFYTVVLTVTDDQGDTDENAVVIDVSVPSITGVFIFELDNFNGDGDLLVGDVSDLGELLGPCGLELSWDDCISSIVLSDGWSATIYSLPDFQGVSVTLTTTHSDFDDFGSDNTTSSIKVFRPGEPVN